MIGIGLNIVNEEMQSLDLPCRTETTIDLQQWLSETNSGQDAFPSLSQTSHVPFSMFTTQEVINKALHAYWASSLCPRGCPIEPLGLFTVRSERPPRVHLHQPSPSIDFSIAFWRERIGSALLSELYAASLRVGIPLIGATIGRKRVQLMFGELSFEFESESGSGVQRIAWQSNFGGQQIDMNTNANPLPVSALLDSVVSGDLAEVIGLYLQPFLSEVRFCLPAIPMPTSSIASLKTVEFVIQDGILAMRPIVRGGHYALFAVSSNGLDPQQRGRTSCPAGSVMNSLLFDPYSAEPSDALCYELEHCIELEEVKHMHAATCSVESAYETPETLQLATHAHCAHVKVGSSIDEPSRESARLPGQCPDDSVVTSVDGRQVRCCGLSGAFVDYNRCYFRRSVHGGSASPFSPWPSQCDDGSAVTAFSLQQSKIVITKCCPVRESVGGCPAGGTAFPCAAHGTCIGKGTCACFPGYAGTACEFQCPVGVGSQPCSEHGTCESAFGGGARCACADGYAGPDCSTALCDFDCNHGQCIVSGFCECDDGYDGKYCNEPTQCSDDQYVCYDFMRDDDKCDLPCHLSRCGDGRDCFKHCPSTCLDVAEDLLDICHPVCRVPACSSTDPSVTEPQCVDFCSPMCQPSQVGDGICDPGCNFEICDFDQGDCEVSTEDNSGTIAVEISASLDLSNPGTIGVRYAAEIALNDGWLETSNCEQREWSLRAQIDGDFLQDNALAMRLEAHAVVYVDELGKSIVVAFRGVNDEEAQWALHILGTSPSQWTWNSTDLEIGVELPANFSVHSGHRRLLDSLWDTIWSHVSYDIRVRGYSITATGTDFGGAMAEMFALRVARMSQGQRRHLA
eukprot:SAG22_NODE_1723_length_3723_cov_1.602373_1_plen_852_part_10